MSTKVQIWEFGKHKKREREKERVPMRMRRLWGLEEHLRRRRCLVMRSMEGVSFKFSAIVNVYVGFFLENSAQ